MKIAHIQHPFIPGMGYQENHLPREQQELSHEVAILSSNYLPQCAEGEENRISAGIYDADGVTLVRHDTIVDLRSIGNPILSGLSESLSDFDPDVVHAHGILSLSTFQAYRFAKRNGLPLFVDVHVDNGNFNLDTLPKRVAFKTYQQLGVPPIVEYATNILPVNPQAEYFLNDHFDIPDHKIELLSLGVPTDVFSPDRGTNDVREKLDIDEDDLLLISAGNLNESKDLEILVKSFARHVGDRDDATLLLLGKWDDRYRAEVKELVGNLDLREEVVLHGAVENDRLPLYYNAADIGVWPGKLGITIIEAIGCGLPIIVSDSMATQFLIDNENGLSFPREDVDALQSRIETYAENPELRSEHSKAAREYAVKTLDWAEIAKQTIRIYESAL